MSERKLSEMLALVATIDPDEYATGSQYSDGIDMQMHREVMFTLLTGTLSIGSTIEFRIYEGTDEGHGTAGEAWVLLQAATDLAATDDDVQVIINIRADQMSAGYRWLRAAVVFGGTADSCDAGLTAHADRTRFSDAVTSSSYGDLTSVDEIIA